MSLIELGLVVRGWWLESEDRVVKSYFFLYLLLLSHTSFFLCYVRQFRALFIVYKVSVQD